MNWVPALVQRLATPEIFTATDNKRYTNGIFDSDTPYGTQGHVCTRQQGTSVLFEVQQLTEGSVRNDSFPSFLLQALKRRGLLPLPLANEGAGEEYSRLAVLPAATSDALNGGASCFLSRKPTTTLLLHVVHLLCIPEWGAGAIRPRGPREDAPLVWIRLMNITSPSSLSLLESTTSSTLLLLEAPTLPLRFPYVIGCLRGGAAVKATCTPCQPVLPAGRRWRQRVKEHLERKRDPARGPAEAFHDNHQSL